MPDCGGVLSKHRTDHSMPMFECQVGHRYSLYEALDAKEHQLENTMWTVAGQVEHVMLMWNEVHQMADVDLIRAAARRRAQLSDHLEIIKRLIQETDYSIMERPTSPEHHT